MAEVQDWSLEGYEVNGMVVSVYDGDSITCRFGLPFAPEHVFNWKCRLQGIDTAELRSRNPVIKRHAIRARDRVSDLAGSKQAVFNLGKFDKYGRLLVSVSIDGVDLANLLIDEGLALAYDGGPRPNWSEYLGGAA